jgi:hypothetical protein
LVLISSCAWFLLPDSGDAETFAALSFAGLSALKGMMVANAGAVIS